MGKQRPDLGATSCSRYAYVMSKTPEKVPQPIQPADVAEGHIRREDTQAQEGQSMTSEADLKKARAEEKFVRLPQRKEDASSANAEQVAEVARVDANTARLRGLRLAKEAADREAAPMAPKKPRAKPSAVKPKS